MILISLGLLGFALLDLIRWSPEEVSVSRAGAAVGGSVVTVVALAALSGFDLIQVLAVGVGAAVVLAPWAAFDYAPLKAGPGRPLAWIFVVLVALFAVTGSADPVEGSVARWYSNLPFGFIETIPADQFVLGVAATLFLTATTNRLVRLVLDAAVQRWEKGEEALTGGRVLGPLERLVIGAIVLAADPAAAAIVIAAKGLLRFPEIRSEAGEHGPDAVTEYFLIGTFTSLVLAATLALLVLAAN